MHEKALDQLLREDPKFLDLAETSSVSISTRLSSVAPSLEQVIGICLGVLYESFGRFVFAILIAFIFS
jgi:hypothetical protein